MEKTEFRKKINGKLNHLACLFLEYRKESADKITIHTKIMVHLSCFAHFLIDNREFLIYLSKEEMLMVRNLLYLAKLEDLESAFVVSKYLEMQKLGENHEKTK